MQLALTPVNLHMLHRILFKCLSVRCPTWSWLLQSNSNPIVLSLCAFPAQVYERALPYFELAAAIQPQEVKWSLMVASCYRRIGAYEQALRRYVPAHCSADVVCIAAVPAVLRGYRLIGLFGRPPGAASA